MVLQQHNNICSQQTSATTNMLSLFAKSGVYTTNTIRVVKIVIMFGFKCTLRINKRSSPVANL
jgi:hypothetical protein